METTQHKPTIYIAGRITGEPDYPIKFRAAQDQLQEAGYQVVNPAILPQIEGWGNDQYLDICFKMIDHCDCICMLPCWRDSKGAKAEAGHALAHGKPIVYYDEWLTDRCADAGTQPPIMTAVDRAGSALKRYALDIAAKLYPNGGQRKGDAHAE